MNITNSKTKALKQSKNKMGSILSKTVDPYKLAREKAEAYRVYVLEVLDNAKRLVSEISADNTPSLDDFVFYSPAGDCMGMDNNPIDFGITQHVDFQEAVEYIHYMLKFSWYYISVEDFYEPSI